MTSYERLTNTSHWSSTATRERALQIVCFSGQTQSPIFIDTIVQTLNVVLVIVLTLSLCLSSPLYFTL